MVTCVRCKLDFGDVKKFCPKCGTRLVPHEGATLEVRAARAEFDARINQSPDDPELRRDYAAYLLSVHLDREALKQLEVALAADPSSLPSRLKMKEAYAALGDWESVIVQLLIIARSEPENTAFLRELAEAYRQVHRVEEAANTLWKIHELDPRDMETLRSLREILPGTERDDQMVAVCRKIVSRDASDVRSWSVLAERLTAHGDRSGSLEAYEAILELDPESPRANYYVGAARHDLAVDAGDQEGFVEVRRLLRVALSSPEGLVADEKTHASVCFLSASLRAGEPTEELLDELDSIDAGRLPRPTIGLYSDCLQLAGHYRLRQGEIETAVAAFEKAHSLTPTESTKERLANAYCRLAQKRVKDGKLGAAASAYESALEHAPADADILKAQESLHTLLAGKRTRRKLAASALALLGLSIVLIIQFGQGKLEIVVTPKATIQIRSSGEILAEASTGRLVSPRLWFGEYDVRIRRDGYAEISKSLRIGFGQGRAPYQFALTPLLTTLTVSSLPPGAIVELDGNELGRTPLTDTEVIAGNATLVVHHPDHGRYQEHVYLEPGATTTIGPVHMTPTGFRLNSAPPGLPVVRLPGKTPLGTTPIEILDLEPGRIALSIEHDGWSWSDEFSVEEGEVLDAPAAICDFDLARLEPSMIADPDAASCEYEANFDTENAGWTEGGSDWGWTKFDQGHMEFAVKSNSRYAWDGPYFADFRATARVRMGQGLYDSYYGLVFSARKMGRDQSWWFFGISDQGKWKVWNYRPDYGRTNVAASGTYSASPRWKTLTAELIGDRLQLFLDGAKMKTIRSTAIPMAGGQIGVGIDGKKSTMYVDRLCATAIPIYSRRGPPTYGPESSESVSYKNGWGWRLLPTAPPPYPYLYSASLRVSRSQVTKGGLVILANEKTRTEGNEVTTEWAALVFKVNPARGWWAATALTYKKESNELMSGTHTSCKGSHVRLHVRIDGDKLEFRCGARRVGILDLATTPHPDGIRAGGVGLFAEDGKATFSDIEVRDLAHGDPVELSKIGTSFPDSPGVRAKPNKSPGSPVARARGSRRERSGPKARRGSSPPAPKRKAPPPLPGLRGGVLER